MRTRQRLAAIGAAMLSLGASSSGLASQPSTSVAQLHAPRAEAPAHAASIHGIVTARPGGFQLSRVSVTLRSATDQSFIRVGATDLEGAFRFEELPAGLYSLEASRAGYERLTVEPFLVLDGVERKQPIALREARPVVPRT